MILRSLELRDVDYFLAIFQDENVTRHIGGLNGSEDAWRKMMTGSAMWPLTGVGMWAAERRSDGQTVGHLGFFDFLRDMTPPIVGEPEMGWIFSTEGQGSGLATEACRAALVWFEEQFGPREIPAIISLENDASMRLAERLGFVRQADATYRDAPISYWRRAASGLPPAASASASAAS